MSSCIDLLRQRLIEVRVNVLKVALGRLDVRSPAAQASVLLALTGQVLNGLISLVRGLVVQPLVEQALVPRDLIIREEDQGCRDLRRSR